MRVVGLTGSIGMGKSTAARIIRRMGVPVHDSDAVVHDLFRQGGAAVPAIAAAFPEAVADGRVDRPTLGRLVFGNAARLTQLEAIVHPLVRDRRDRFLARHRRARRRLVVLDVPLLLETGGETICDAVLVVTAPAWLQRQRVLARHGMTADRLAQILQRQMPDREKRRRADVVVTTALGYADTARRLRRALNWIGRHA